MASSNMAWWKIPGLLRWCFHVSPGADDTVSRWPINFAGESRFGSWRINETTSERPARKHHAIVIYSNSYCIYIYTDIHIHILMMSNDVYWCLMSLCLINPNHAISPLIQVIRMALQIFRSGSGSAGFRPESHDDSRHSWIFQYYHYISLLYHYYYLVGGFNPSEKYWSILVNGRMIPYIMENKKCLKPPTGYHSDSVLMSKKLWYLNIFKAFYPHSISMNFLISWENSPIDVGIRQQSADALDSDPRFSTAAAASSIALDKSIRGRGWADVKG